MSDSNQDATIAKAIEAGISATKPTPLGEFGVLTMVPPGYNVIATDMRPYEEFPQQRKGEFQFATVESLVRYVNRYKDANTLGYAFDVNGNGAAMLVEQTSVFSYVLDDHPTPDQTHKGANRVHLATLVLKPTAAGRRWGRAFSSLLTQEQLLDLIVDGIGEIAEPDGATLRDLVSDLHAIRTSEVNSVVRTGGEATLVTSSNVKLHSGLGSEVKVPEMIEVVLRPFTASTQRIQIQVRIKPQISNTTVYFDLSCSELDEMLETLVDALAAVVDEATEIDPLWQP
jgi:hypothetical protein